MKMPAVHERAPVMPPLSGAARKRAMAGGRVLMTVDAVGGVWRYAMQLAAAMRRTGVETVFAGMGPPPDAGQAAEAEAIGELVWLDVPLEWMSGGPDDLEPLPDRLLRVADDHRVDLLHLNAPAHAAKLDTDLPVIVVSHSCVVTWWQTMRATGLPPQWQWQHERNQQGFMRADIVAAPSRSHAELLRRCYEPLPDIKVIHNASRLETGDRPYRKEPFVFAAGRWWDEGKGGRSLDSAAASTVWPVIMAGSLSSPGGHELSLHHAQACGELGYEQAIAMMQKAGILASPSLYEPFGLAALEGALSGCDLVLADIPTYRELWTDAAFFFEAGNPDCLAAAINRLALQPALRAELARRAAQRASQLAPEMQADATAALYAELLNPAANPAAAVQ